MVIRRVGPLSCAKVAGLLYLILGFVFGAFISLFALGRSARQPIGGTVWWRAVRRWRDRDSSHLLRLFGFVGTLIMASLFNLVAGITGGIEVDAS